MHAGFVLSPWLGRVDLITAWLLAAVWIAQIIQATMGMRTIADLNNAKFDVPAGGVLPNGRVPKVTIIVPARNEAHTIEPALRSLRHLEYPNYEIIAIDDRSEDSTLEIMRRVANETGGAPVYVLQITELPEGWLGKTHAMWRGTQEGTGDWILFTDADVAFRPDTLRRAMAYAEGAAIDHLVLFPTMVVHSPGERMMMALFQALVGFGHRPWKIADSKARDYIGIGAFNLVRRSVYEKIGTYAGMKLAVIDDMQLGKMVKKHGFQQRVVFGIDLARIHWATGAFGIVHNLSKNMFAYVRFNVGLALAVVFGILFLNLLPFVGLILASGWAWGGYALAALCIFVVYLNMSKKTDIPVWYIVTHAISSVLVAYTVLLSTFQTLKNGGVRWRGTLYPLDQLRKGLD